MRPTNIAARAGRWSAQHRRIAILGWFAFVIAATLAATAAVQARHPELRVEQLGAASADKAFEESLGEDFAKAETLSLPLTLVILLVAFGALVAAGLPLLLGLTAVGATLGLLGPISQLTPVTDQISSVILLIGLAVGVDY